MKVFLVIGALAVALGIAFGAFGAHGLSKRVDAGQLIVWKTATDYHIYTAIGLILVGIMLKFFPGFSAWVGAGTVIGVGGLLFSGSLYLLVLTGMRWLGPITPLGGLLMIIGWCWFAWAAFHSSL
ncbi:MAG TPA: DUF423 domain-containing protein [Alcanivoracaceae bacterium]|nr:DUF423 domain-containing protein [Alcanivoracaceae bacterium]